MPPIDVVGVGYAHAGPGGEVRVLSDVSLQVGAGELVCIRGPSGAGKSTLLRVLGCLDRASEGSYRFCGEDVGALDHDGLARLRLEGIGFVFQDFQLLDAATAERNVELPAACLAVDAGTRRRRARELLDLVGLAGRHGHYPGELSGGERQRVGVARALMNDARVVLADEPTGSLDSAQADGVLALLGRVAARGHAVVVVSHDAAVAGRADRVVELAGGRVVGGVPAAPCPPVARRAAQPAVRRSRWGSGALADMLRGLRGGGVRTALMAFAAVAGVAAVVVLMGMSSGAYGGVAGAVADMGAARITVTPASHRLVGAREEGRFEPVPRVGLTLRDVELIESRVDNVRAAYAKLARELDVGRGGRVLDNVLVLAQSGTALRTITLDRPWPVARGAGLSARDIGEAHPVAVVGPTVRDKLFGPGEEPLGAHVQIGGAPFEIKGVLGPHPVPADFWAHNRTADEVAHVVEQRGTVVFLPFRTAVETLFGAETVRRHMTIAVETEDAARAGETARAIRDLIVGTHGREGVNVKVDATLADAYAEVTGLGAATLAGVGVVALLGTALVVMSAMLTAVDARKREIGLRMAFGARRTDVLVQFLGEAVLVVAAGGAVGAVAGHLAGPYLSSLANFPFAGEPWFAGAAVVCAAGTGMLAGTVPAWLAARVQPAAWLAPR